MIFFSICLSSQNYCHLHEDRGLFDLIHNSVLCPIARKTFNQHTFLEKKNPSSYYESQTYGGQAQTYMASCGLYITPPYFLGKVMEGQRGYGFCRARSFHPGLVGHAVQSWAWQAGQPASRLLFCLPPLLGGEQQLWPLLVFP